MKTINQLSERKLRILARRVTKHAHGYIDNIPYEREEFLKGVKRYEALVIRIRDERIRRIMP
jgi:hypothetical protein